MVCRTSQESIYEQAVTFQNRLLTRITHDYSVYHVFIKKYNGFINSLRITNPSTVFNTQLHGNSNLDFGKDYVPLDPSNYDPDKPSSNHIKQQDTTTSTDYAFPHAHNDTIAAKRAPTLVLLHGYVCGLAMWTPNINGLAQHFDDIRAIDCLGFGLSSKKLPDVKFKDENEADDFWIDSLEEWRIKEGLDKDIILVGHSLGGYIAAAYAVKYPKHIKHLILASPVGVPYKRIENPTWAQKTFLFNLFKVYPYTALSVLGDNVGRNLFFRYNQVRFKREHNDTEFVEYLYEIMRLKGDSGERAFREAFVPVAYAKRPLEDRLINFPKPVTFLYGSHDWMDCEHGLKVSNTLDKSKLFLVPNAGHMLTFDNPEFFNQVVINTLYEQN